MGTDTPGIDPGTYSCAGSYSYGFEDRADLTDINGTMSGPLAFSTTNGDSWYVLSGSLNQYYAIQGTTVGFDEGADGRIDFTDGPVSSFSALVSNYEGSPTMKAYDASGTLLATAGPAATSIDFSKAPDDQTVDKLAVADSTADIAYVIFGGQSDRYVEDALCVNGEGQGQGNQSQAITITSTAPTGAVVGDTYTVTATGGGSGNPVTFTADSSSTACTVTDNGDSTATVTATAVGTCVIDANQAGSDGYDPAAQVQQSFSVAIAPQAISFTSTPPSPAAVGDTYTVTATGGGSGNPVLFFADPKSKGCTVTQAGLVRFTSVGTCRVDASQAGNANYKTAPTVQQQIKIGLAAQTITFTSTPPAHALAGTTYTATATGGGSGKPVVFSAGTTPPSVCTVTSAGDVTFTGPGKCIVNANQAGNAQYSQAKTAKQTVLVYRK